MHRTALPFPPHSAATADACTSVVRTACTCGRGRGQWPFGYCASQVCGRVWQRVFICASSDAPPNVRQRTWLLLAHWCSSACGHRGQACWVHRERRARERCPAPTVWSTPRGHCVLARHMQHGPHLFVLRQCQRVHVTTEVRQRAPVFPQRIHRQRCLGLFNPAVTLR